MEFLLKRFGPRMASTGRELGKALAKFGPVFPPIWTELSLIIKANGSHSGSVRRHSLFPSMSFYVQDSKAVPSGINFERADYYDGTASRFDDWFLHGWGAGNPWGVPFP